MLQSIEYLSLRLKLLSQTNSLASFPTQITQSMRTDSFFLEQVLAQGSL
jgi:hypothetical protein